MPEPSWHAELLKFRTTAEIAYVTGDPNGGHKSLAEAMTLAAAGKLSCTTCGGKLPAPGHKATCSIAGAYHELFGRPEPAVPQPQKAKGGDRKSAAFRASRKSDAVQEPRTKRKYTKRKVSSTKVKRGAPRPMPRGTDGKFASKAE